jgi:hypothetical protein
MKKKLKIIIPILLIVILGLGIYLIINKESKKEANIANVNLNNTISSLLSDDYYLNKLIYGKPDIYDSYIKNDDGNYYELKDERLTSLDQIYKMINNNYGGATKETLLKDINKYNKYIMFGKKIYVLVNSKCETPKYNKNFKIITNKDNKIYLNNNNYEFYIFKIDKTYKLAFNPYGCKKEITTKSTN